MDDQTVAYAMAAQPCFEDLKQVASQLAGLLVLEAACGAAGETPGHPLLASAERTWRQAADGLRSARVSPGARLHHGHLIGASAKLGEALRSMRERRDPLALVEGAYAELRAASKTLPGFPMISFERACCGGTK